MNPSQFTAGTLLHLWMLLMGYFFLVQWRRQSKLPVGQRSLPLLALYCMSMACFAMAIIVAMVVIAVVR